MIRNFSSSINNPALCMVLAMAIVGVIDNFIVIIARNSSLWQFLCLRAVVALPLVLLLSSVGIGTIYPKKLWATILRNSLIAVAMLFYFFCLSIMPISQALAGLFTSPIFILIINAVLLKKRIGLFRVFAVAAGFTGTLLVLEVRPANLHWLNLIPIISGMFYALGSIATRRYCEKESTLSMLAILLIIQFFMGFFVMAFLVAFPLPHFTSNNFLFSVWDSNFLKAMPLIILQSVGAIFGVGLIIRSYQIGEPSYVAVYEYSVFIFGPLFAWFALKQTISAIQIVGIIFVVVAGSIITLQNQE